jgi:hypothetical protein
VKPDKKSVTAQPEWKASGRANLPVSVIVDPPVRLRRLLCGGEAAKHAGTVLQFYDSNGMYRCFGDLLSALRRFYGLRRLWAILQPLLG